MKVTLRNAEACFRSHYPSAKVEGHTGHDRKRYYLIRIGREQMPCGEGDTKMKAWRDACANKNITESAS